MPWTKEKPVKPGLYAAIHLVKEYSGYGKVQLISIVESLEPPPSKNPEPGFDWEKYDAPIEEWIRGLEAWQTGADGPAPLDWFTWFFELSIDPVPAEVSELKKTYNPDDV